MAKITVSLFNNKGGVGKTSIVWNLGVSIASFGKRVLLVDFDPQCNLSIAVVGSTMLESCLEASEELPYGKTIRSFALPYIHQNKPGEIYTFDSEMSKPTSDAVLEIVLGDFWLNHFADTLNVGTDVLGGAGLYRFLLLHRMVEEIERKKELEYDVVLIDLPPSFNTLVRSALYCSDYFIVPCTPDLFSAYCVGLIGEVLPNFAEDWEQGKNRYMTATPYDPLIKTKGQPKFGGWIFNGFDTRNTKRTAADTAQYNKILDAVTHRLIEPLRKIKSYECVPNYVNSEPVAEIEDLNVLAPDSINKNLPIKKLSGAKPTRNVVGTGSWSQGQRELMTKTDSQFDKLGKYVIERFSPVS